MQGSLKTIRGDGTALLLWFGLGVDRLPVDEPSSDRLGPTNDFQLLSRFATAGGAGFKDESFVVSEGDRYGRGIGNNVTE